MSSELNISDMRLRMIIIILCYDKTNCPSPFSICYPRNLYNIIHDTYFMTLLFIYTHSLNISDNVTGCQQHTRCYVGAHKHLLLFLGPGESNCH